MKTKYNILALMLFITPVFAGEQVSREVIWNDIWRAVKARYAGFDSLSAARWENCFDSVRNQGNSAASDVEFWRIMRGQVATLDDGETEIFFPPDLPQLYDTVPIRLVKLGERIFISKLSSAPGIGTSGVNVGDEIFKVDGEPVFERLKRECIPQVSAATLSAKQAKAVWRLLTGPAGTTAKLIVRKPDGIFVEIDLSRTTGAGNRYWTELFVSDTPDIQRLDGDCLYANFGRTLSLKTQQDVLNRIADPKDIKAIILDLRETQTGEIFTELLSRLIPFDITLGPYQEVRWETDSSGNTRRMLKPSPETWISASPPIFRGIIVALTGPLTEGVAEQFLQPLVFSNRVVLIGDTTGGSGGKASEISIAGGGRLMVTTIWPNWEGGCGARAGFPPTICIEMSPTDLSGSKDRVLEAAKDYVRQRLGNTE